MSRPKRSPLPGFPALRDEIRASPFSLTEVAAEAGLVSKSTLHRYLSGTRNAPLNLEVRVRAALARLYEEQAAREARRAKQAGDAA